MKSNNLKLFEFSQSLFPSTWYDLESLTQGKCLCGASVHALHVAVWIFLVSTKKPSTN